MTPVVAAGFSNAAPYHAWPRRLLLAGAGRMGGALLRGWIARGLPAMSVHIVEPQPDDALIRFCADSGATLGAPEGDVDALVLAVKPQTFEAASASLTSLVVPETLVVSILAGKTLRNLRAGLPTAGAIVRAMPNLPAAIGRGASGLTAEGRATVEQRAIAQTLLGAVGIVEWLDESLLDAVTAVSGSGPAYLFHLVEALAAAGMAEGLPAEVAARLARATVEGAGALLGAEADQSAAELRTAVTSPGGTTAAGLAVLMDAEQGLTALMTTTVAAARKRAGELAG